MAVLVALISQGCAAAIVVTPVAGGVIGGVLGAASTDEEGQRRTSTGVALGTALGLLADVGIIVVAFTRLDFGPYGPTD
jgi:hypothetical protein